MSKHPTPIDVHDGSRMRMRRMMLVEEIALRDGE
jgi:hypothetical protein